MMGAMETFTIGQTAKRAGVKVATLRYYERRRLLAPPARRRSGYVHGGYRIYTDVDVDRIRFIRNAQKLGFSLEEIAELLALRSDGAANCADVKNKTEAKLNDVRRKIRSLRKDSWFIQLHIPVKLLSSSRYNDSKPLSEKSARTTKYIASGN